MYMYMYMYMCVCVSKGKDPCGLVNNLDIDKWSDNLPANIAWAKVPQEENTLIRPVCTRIQDVGNE